MADFPDLREVFSVENILKLATNPFKQEEEEPQPTGLRLPAEYGEENPDTLLMDTRKTLANMSPAYGLAKGLIAPRSAPAPSPMMTPLDGKTPKIPLVGAGITKDFLTDIIRKRESSGNYTALNKEAVGNTASGAYQYTDSTWNGYGGYAKAMLAPKAVQDRRFQEDIARRVLKYNGDPFKVIAEHYLPAWANQPQNWTKEYVFKNGKRVKPVASYIRYVVKGTPLEQSFDEYLKYQQQAQ